MQNFTPKRKLFLVVFITLSTTFSWAQTTVNFNFTGGIQNWVVPPCVTSITIVAEGAQGGNADSQSNGPGFVPGGLGAVVTATIPVVPGDNISINVGGQGGLGTAGYNGGGTGFFSSDGNLNNASAGGGGSTNINVNGIPYIIAAGGGGAGGGTWTFSPENNGGGDGGCVSGEAPNPGSPWIGVGGGGGTQTGPGAGGAPWAGVPPGGSSGVGGTGGMGGQWQTASGGGGGGGYFGGGGGGNDGCCTGANGGAGGGGGSSLVPGGAGCVQGANTGNGVVSITYSSAAPTMTSPNTATICSNGTVNIPLTATMPSVFTWVAADNPNTTGESTVVQNTSTLINTIVNNTTVPQVVQYTVTPTAAPGGCAGTPQTVNVTMNPSPTMTSTNATSICSGTAVNIPLTANMGSTFTWIAADNANVAGESLVMQFTSTLNNTLTNNTATPQVVTYTVTPTSSPGGCPGVPQTVNVTVNPTPSVTDPADQLLCANTNTLPVIFNGPVAGTTYSWTNNNTAIGLGAAGVGDIATFVATNGGAASITATITVTPTAATCVGTPQTFTITVNPIPTVADPANQTVCAGSLTTAVNFTGPVAGTTFDWTNNTPAIGLAGAGSGNIGAFAGVNGGVTAVTATVTVTPTAAACVGPAQTWTYTISPNLVAGNDNSATICNSAGSTIDLNTLLVGNNTTGTWAETTGSGQFNAGTGVFDGGGLIAGNYTFTYTVTGIAPCLNDVANFTITVSDLPNSGADNAATLCNSAGTTLNLNTLLSGADAGGAWTETTGTPSGQFNTATGVLTADGVPAGTYTFAYTIAAVGPCPGDQAVFTITINQFVTAGADNNAFVLCNLPGSLFDINTALAGNNTVGTWAETTVPPSGQFDPVSGTFDASGLAEGLYNFTYDVTGAAPCTNDQALITLTVEQTADAGADNNASICNVPGNTIDLNTLLSGNNAPGAWVETSGSGQFNAATGVFDASSLAAGAYTFTYTVTGTPPCTSDAADFIVTVEQEALAGLDNSAALCNIAGTTLDLNTLLNGNNQVGTWAETSASGQFNAATGIFDASGLAPGTFTFTYTVAATAPCVQDVADFSIAVEQNAQAGLDNNASICNAAGNTIDLNTLLNGNNGVGAWTENTASGQFNATTGVLNAAGLAPGDYTFTYTVSAIAPCASDDASFTVTVEQEAVAGADNSASLCNTAGTTIDLDALLAGNNGPGTWAETTAMPSGQFTPATGVLNAAGLPAGNYTFTFTVGATAPCVPDAADFTITIQQEVTAGIDNNDDICNTAGNTLDLNSLLVGNDAGGVWSETSASGQFNAATGIFNAGGLAGATYTFTYTVNAVAPCLLDVANFSVDVNAIPNVNAGVDQTVCDGTLVTLSGSGAVNYFWSGTVNNGIPFLQPVGTTTYTVTGTDNNGCTNTDVVNVTVNEVPDVAFYGDDLSGCAPFTVTFHNLTLLAGNNCTWSFGDGVTGNGCDSVTYTYGNPGTYNVGLTVTTAQGCSSSATYNSYVTVVPFPVASFTYDPDVVTVENTEVEFTNESTDADSYSWDFGDETATSMETDPTHEFPVVGNIDYTVLLTAYSDEGCSSTYEVIVNVQDVLIFFVPNIFTPDGDDVNNVFLPVFTSGFDIYDYHLAIYDRWGEVLFESFNSEVGWSGTYGTQGLVEDGVYIWHIEFGDNRSDKRHEHHGHVTVLK